MKIIKLLTIEWNEIEEGEMSVELQEKQFEAHLGRAAGLRRHRPWTRPWEPQKQDDDQEERKEEQSDQERNQGK